MTLKAKWIELLYNVATGSRKIRNFFTPIGALFYGLLTFSFVVVALQVDRLIGITHIFPSPDRLRLSWLSLFLRSRCF
jgi:hypothetical protein